MAKYESEFTKFMQEWLKKHPEEKMVRQQGYALWWNKSQSAEKHDFCYILSK